MESNRNADRPAFMAADTNFLSIAVQDLLTQTFSLRTAAIAYCFGEGMGGSFLYLPPVKNSKVLAALIGLKNLPTPG